MSSALRRVVMGVAVASAWAAAALVGREVQDAAAARGARADGYPVAAIQSPGPAAEMPNPAQPESGPLSAAPLDDPVEPAAATGRSESDSDRLEAAACYSAAQLARRHDQFERALQLFQRAHRCDPDSLLVLREIVSLAFQLDRHSVAVRYALKVAERESNDPALLIRLARHLLEEDQSPGPGQSQVDRAERLYRRADEIVGPNATSPLALELALELGAIYERRGEYARAVAACQRVVRALEDPATFGLDDELASRLKTASRDLYQALGAGLLKSDRCDEALAFFRRSHAEHPDASLLAWNLATVAEKQGRAADGLADLQPLLDAQETRFGTAPYALWVRLLSATGQAADRILERLEIQLASDPDNFPLRLLTAERAHDLQRYDVARKHFRRALHLATAAEQFEVWLAMIRLELATGDAARLLTALGGALESSDAWSDLGDAGVEIIANHPLANAMVDEALSHLTDAGSRLPGGRFLAAASLATALDRLDDANRLFAAAFDALPEKAPAVLDAWGLALISARRYQEAADVYRRGMDGERFPSRSSEFQLLVASTLALSGETDAGLLAARQAAESAPESVRAARRAADILAYAERTDEAAVAYAEVIERFGDRDDDEIRDELRAVRAALADLETTRGHAAEAEQWLEQILDEYPDDPGAQNDLGYLWADSGRHLQRALRMIELAVAAEPQNLAFRDSLGWVYYRLGRLTDALAELRRASDREEADPTILDHLAEVLHAAGQPDQAVNVWDRARHLYDTRGETAASHKIQEKLERARSRISPAGPE